MKAAVVRVSGAPPVIEDPLPIDPDSDLGVGAVPDLGAGAEPELGSAPGPEQFVPHDDAAPGRVLLRHGAARTAPPPTVNETALSAVCPGPGQGGRLAFVAVAAHGTIPAPIVDTVRNGTRVTGSSAGTRQDDLVEVVTVRAADGPHPGGPCVPSPDPAAESTDGSRSPEPIGPGSAGATRPRTPAPNRPPTCTPDDLLAAPAR